MSVTGATVAKGVSGPHTLLLAMALSLQWSTCAARTWTGNPQGTGDAPTIQAAVDSTSPGDTVMVLAGQYTERVHMEGIHLVGESPPGSASIVVPSQEAYVVAVVNGTVSGLDLAGAYGGYGWADGGTVTALTGATITDCIVHDSGRAIVAFDSFSLTGCTIERAGAVWIEPSCGATVEIRDCVFHDDDSVGGTVLLGPVAPGCQSQLTVMDCVFDHSPSFGAVPSIVWDLEGGSLQVTVRRNLFRENTGPAAGPGWAGVPGPHRGVGPGEAVVEISENTIVQQQGRGLGNGAFGLTPGTVIQGNVIAGCAGIGLDLTDASDVSVLCNDIWGNGTNYVGGPDLTGTDGNVSEYPRFCDPENGDFTVAANSVLLPANNSCGVQIGAFGRGCAAVSVEPASWGSIKARYRN